MIGVPAKATPDFAEDLPESADELQAVVAAERKQLKRSLDELGNAVREKVNVRSRLRENPLITVGAAFTAGIVLGVLSNRATGGAPDGNAPARPIWHSSPSRPSVGSAFGHMASTIAALVGQRLASVAEESVRSALAHRRDASAARTATRDT